MTSHAWGYAPDVIEEYLPVLRRFGADAAMLSWAEGFVGSHSGRSVWDANFLSANYRLKSCINIGGAPFLFEYLLKKSNPQMEIVSVDIGNRFPGAAEALGIKIIEADIEQRECELERYAGQFDCVSFCEVFEHLRIDLLRTVTMLRSLLRKDGILYLTTPNGVGLTALIHYPLRGRTGLPPVVEWGRLQKIGHMGHVREYSFPEVSEVLVHCGFKIEKLLYRRMLQGSRLPDYTIGTLVWLIPRLSDELVILARNPGG